MASLHTKTGRKAREKMAGQIAVVTDSGRIVIPLKLRHKYGLRKGTRVALVDEGSRLTLLPLTADYIRSLRGMLKGGPSVLDYFLKERKSTLA